MFVSACASINMAVKADTGFTRHSRIAVISLGVDYMNVKGQLEYLLLDRGFVVVSDVVARESLKREGTSESAGVGEAVGDSNSVDVGVGTKTVIEESLRLETDIPATHILKFEYKQSTTGGFRTMFVAFSASIVELNTGDVVATISVPGKTSINPVLEGFVDEVASQIPE